MRKREFQNYYMKDSYMPFSILTKGTQIAIDREINKSGKLYMHHPF